MNSPHRQTTALQTNVLQTMPCKKKPQLLGGRGEQPSLALSREYMKGV